MRVLLCRFLVLIVLIGGVLLSSCSDDPTDIVTEEPPRLLPEPTLEYVHPLANTDLTFSQVLDVARDDVDLIVATAESTLTALVTAGMPLRDAWVTGGRDYNPATASVFVAVRLARSDTSIAGHGFSAGAVVRAYQQEDMRHYAFHPNHADNLPEKVFELRQIEKPPGLVYFRNWYPDAHSTYYGGYVLSDKWLSGAEFYVQSLVDAGVAVNNAWVSATNYQCQWGGRGIVLEVDAPHPVLDASGFVEGWGNYVPGGGELCADFMWNYCFDKCPGAVELPQPERMWTLLTPERYRIYWRSVPSQDYDALFGSQERVEQQLQEMMRARAPIERAWIPVMAAAGEYTYMAVECRDTRVWWWGYEDEPAGGVTDVNRWTYVRCYDLRDDPHGDELERAKPRDVEQGFEGDP